MFTSFASNCFRTGGQILLGAVRSKPTCALPRMLSLLPHPDRGPCTWSFVSVACFSSKSKASPSSKSTSTSTSTSPLAASASALRLQQRSKKRVLSPGKGQWSVVGYSTAAAYDLMTLSERLAEQGLYEASPLVDELVPICLYAKATYQFEDESNELTQKEMFFFEQGSVVFWNVPELEQENVLNFLRQGNVEIDSYPEDTVRDESEMMSYRVAQEENGNGTSLKGGVISLDPAGGTTLEKYSFSNGIAASVKLGALEASLDRIIDSIEHLSEDMKRGRRILLSRKDVLRKTGEIFALRHVLNLSSDLLDTPDFYWDRENLEKLYHGTCAHLTVSKRTRIMNEKLTHCYELIELITSTLNDEHHVKLEWYIIILIMIEVVFELWHFVERYLH